MRVVADLGMCEGLGMCEAMAPDFFEVGEDDTVVPPQHDIEEAERSHVRAAVDACPVRALSLAG